MDLSLISENSILPQRTLGFVELHITAKTYKAIKHHRKKAARDCAVGVVSSHGAALRVTPEPVIKAFYNRPGN